ncbi:plexin-A1-like isoform X3 [Mizuhopecten yessoensis]|uniref:plexin-A1-like isoform X3 n=1 Tax=Mizuhopecten yessoensis TaxID=6573 RepID=UPI000B45A0C8|nr:plexin-A1-like isoform X3 [Mizuhopecten yessoensis]
MERKWMLMMWVCSLVLLLGAKLLHGENVYSKQEVNLLPLSGSRTTPFLNHLVIHNNLLYIGAVNRIFKLSFNLSILANMSTGPQNDSALCDLPPSGDRCMHKKSLRDNVNKVLLIHQPRGERPMLITCGSIFQGACETRFSNNLQLNQKYYGQLESMRSDLPLQDVYAIAADTEKGSTVAYIAPGAKGNDVIYIASAYTGLNNRLIRQNIPAISTRKLGPRDDIFSFSAIESSPITQRASSVSIKESIRSTFFVNYITGFTSGNYSYFVTTQPKSQNKGSPTTISKLIHLCQQDEWLTSYVDLPLVCRKGGKVYNKVTSARVIQPALILQKSMTLMPGAEEVLVATFTDDSEKHSAVCVFGMGEVRKKVVANVRLCRMGNSSANGNKYIESGAECRFNDKMESDESLLCFKVPSRSFSRIAGILGVEAQPVLTYENMTFTSIALSTTTDFTVAFLGTNQGDIKKIVITSNLNATEYDQTHHTDLTIDPGSSINKDMQLDPTNQYLFTMSEKTVAMLRVENCQRHSSCQECLSSQDPYCGWCTLENRCTVRSLCTNPDIDRWANGQVGNCITIMDTSPPSASASVVIKVHLSILKLPRMTNYSCVFALDAGPWSVPAERWSYGLTCQTPNVTNFVLLFGEAGHRDIKLSINSTETGKLFVSKNFTFYNCESFKSCSPCTDNRWSCDWCIYENKCLYNSGNCDPRGIIVSRNETDDDNSTEVASSIRYSGEGRRGPNHCPRVDRSKTEPVYIPNMKAKPITIRGFNFPERLPGMEGYRSEIRIPDTLTTVRAHCDRLDSEIIRCHIPERNYVFKTGKFQADLRIFFGNNTEVENDATQVTIYSCTKLGNGDCSYCKYMQHHEIQLDCAWCQGTCEYREFCADTRAQIWSSGDTCPPPRIHSIDPNNGTKMGGTRVTLTGHNLGTEFKDIQNNVSIAGVPCRPIKELYRPSKIIVCVIGPSDHGDKSGGVTVLTYVFNKIIFHYLSPSIEKVTPAHGPKSGGSSITVKGLHLNAGNNISISINNRTCQIIGHVGQRSVTCTTPPSPQTGDEMIRASIDGNDIYGSLMFRYYDDPTIKSISPVRSFFSGGRNITVTGTNFTCIQRPRMFTIFAAKRSKECDCYIFNSTMMKCPTPHMTVHDELERVDRLRRSTQQLSAEIGFIMDNVLSVQNLSRNFPDVASSLDYFSDPQVFNFTEQGGLKEFKGEVLIIRGQGLNVAASKEDVTVMIGEKMCNVTNLVENEIYCTPPTTQPQTIQRNGVPSNSNAPQVIVKIGNREYQIGFLAYETPSPEGSMLVYIISGVVAIVVVILVAVILFALFYHRQKTRSKREFRKMQIQLDSLESNVRNECRQAFAELQTDMTDLTNDLDASKKPFYSFESYTFNVLFPGMLDHVILHPPMQKNGNIDRHPDIGIVHFNQLLQNKHFLLLLIRTLEKQKSFSIRDKSNVASLLMILYQNNMEYATEILKTLLADLIEKSVDSKHPKLMLRRTESVVEKLLANWLSLCLYKYLVEESNFPDSAGSSLYILYKAIKVQVEKGPIDHVTCDARYSLSEDRLLRTECKLEVEMLNLNVEYEGKKYKCRVLDCDTITQAKEKMLDTIFRNFAYSQRPVAAELDLELSNSGRMMLDEDNTTIKVDGWKQLNTLRHYKVLDHSEMVLTHHQNCRTMPRSPNGSVHSMGYPHRDAVPIARTENEVGTKIWHLVKQHDDCNNGGGLKMSSEIYLTRLLSTKGTLKQYIDDFFEMVLKVDSSMPPVIKYLFDMMDQAADRFNITDPDVVHTWKCNSLLLRFWVNIIKNPNFVYDIQKPSIVDSCLSVVAQTFMDSCSTSEHRLGKDSPSNKLLFAKDIPKYRKWVEKYFSDIQAMPAVSDQDLNAYLADVSRMSTGHFTKENALYELYNYVQKYNNEINESLEADGFANAQQLPAKLGHVITAMEGPNPYMRDYV